VSNTTQSAVIDEEQYAQEWGQWRAQWEGYVSGPHGWLSPVDLHFVDETPQQFPGLPGRWWQSDGAFYVDPDGTPMAYEGRSFTSQQRFDFATEEDDRRIVVGDLEIGVTYRETFMMVVYDPTAPRRQEFTGVPVYPPNLRWVLNAQFEPFESPEEVVLGSVSGRFTKARQSVGIAHFEFEGVKYDLRVVEAFGSATVSFNDLTNGITTFPLVRWIPVTVPDGGGAGEMTLDFNRALNLPCAFSDAFPICPVPVASNRLQFAVEAGEKTPNGPMELNGPLKNGLNER